MADTLQYLSSAWRDEAEKRLRATLKPEKMKFITFSKRCLPWSVTGH